jgi:hypothetical protein
MVLSIQELKIVQPTLNMRRPDTVAALSGRNQKSPITQAFSQYVSTGVPNSSIPGGFINLPVNRIFGFFPIAKGTLESTKMYVRPLSNNNVFLQQVEDIRVNDQRQLTDRNVVGMNFQQRVGSPYRFRNYAGNAKATSGADSSKAKHANSWQDSDLAGYLGRQITAFQQNPLVVDSTKRALQSAKQANRRGEE